MPRIGHLKSRRGCRLCKTRKVKCDESRPSCTWCSKHNVACIYDYDAIVIHAYPATSAAAQCDTPSSTSADTDHAELPLLPATSVGDLQVHELFLLHHFTSDVARHFATEQMSPPRSIYAEEMVQVAFDYSFLLDAILAASAEHLQLTTSRSQIPASLQEVDFSHLHHYHLDRAIRGQREALINVDPKNAPAVFFTSVLLSIASMQPLRSGDEVYVPPVAWLTMANAIATVSLAALPKLPPGSVIQRLIGADKVDYFSMYDPVLLQGLVKGSCGMQHFARLLEFVDSSYTESQDEMVACQTAVAIVSGIYDTIRSSESHAQICRRLMSFGPLISSLFVSMLERRVSRALAILAQYMALTRMVDRMVYWWFGGVAEREVRGLRSILPAKWQWAMEWPMLVVASGDLAVAEGPVGLERPILLPPEC